MHIIDLKLMKIHEAMERMGQLFFLECQRDAAQIEFIQEKERCHELMAEISEEANKETEGSRQ